MRLLLAAATAMLTASGTSARPVSWPGGVTLIGEFNPYSATLVTHYTPSRHYSLGLRAMRMRDDRWNAAGAQATWLARRWNMPAAQANIYVTGFAGAAWEDGRAARPAAGIETQADWENRRVMVMAMAHYLWADRIDRGDMQLLRGGWAPYAGEYGDLHLWLFGQLRRDTMSRDRLQPALIARAFYGRTMLEAGVTDRGGLILNLQQRF